jgi:hypothetical protein
VQNLDENRNSICRVLSRLVDGKLGFMVACLRYMKAVLTRADRWVSWSMRSPARLGGRQAILVKNNAILKYKCNSG